MVQMIAMDRPRKIEEFYEAYKDVPTPLGSCYLAKFLTMRRPALAFGPSSEGQIPSSLDLPALVFCLCDTHSEEVEN